MAKVCGEAMEELVEKYKKRLSEQLDIAATRGSGVYSREYKAFREEWLPPQLSRFEKVCNACGKMLQMKLKDADRAKIAEHLESAHLQTTPEAVMAASVILPLGVMIAGITISLFFNSLFFTMFSVLLGIAGFFLIQKTPAYLANQWRMRASNQMVLCVFYVVTYMRHTSNLELAIEFASEHLAPPLSLDLRKVLWDVQSARYETVKDSLESYLEKWRASNREFVDSFHLIEGSLYETSEERRVSLLDKSLDVMLDETYEKMLHYAQNLKGPITMLHMLGVILPILGLVILPLVVSFMEGVSWVHIAALYNVVLPIVVYFLGRNILSQRPTGYGDTDVAEINPELRKYRNVIVRVGGAEIQIHPAILCIALGAVFGILSLLPLLIHAFNPFYDVDIGGFKMLDYKESTLREGVLIGPYGLGASLISLLIPAGLAISIGLFFRLRSENVIKIRNEAKKLEDEFSAALFQLGNRLGDGLPAEIAFQKVASVMEDTTAGRFFKLVALNISKLGMGVKEAIFNSKSGAIVSFPSAIIQSSMKVLIESVKKGPLIAAQALLNVSRYIKEIHKVNERLKDLMADIISDMKSQIAFLTPAIAGIVIGITSMITFILGNLRSNIEVLGTQAAGTQIGALATFFGDGIPTYYFQAVVGIYVFQIVYVLTILANGIENGADKLEERYLLGQNLLKSTLLYCFIAGTVMVIFNVIALNIVGTSLVLAT